MRGDAHGGKRIPRGKITLRAQLDTNRYFGIPAGRVRLVKSGSLVGPRSRYFWKNGKTGMRTNMDNLAKWGIGKDGKSRRAEIGRNGKTENQYVR